MGQKGNKVWRAGGLDATILWHDNNWWLSICVECDKPRDHGRHEHTVRFDLVDGFALVNGRPSSPEGLPQLMQLSEQLDALKVPARPTPQR